jgi:hypothetical protein
MIRPVHVNKSIQISVESIIPNNFLANFVMLVPELAIPTLFHLWVLDGLWLVLCG